MRLNADQISSGNLREGLLSSLLMRKSSYPSEIIMELLSVLFPEQAFGTSPISLRTDCDFKGEPDETVSEQCHEFLESE